MISKLESRVVAAGGIETKLSGTLTCRNHVVLKEKSENQDNKNLHHPVSSKASIRMSELAYTKRNFSALVNKGV